MRQVILFCLFALSLFANQSSSYPYLSETIWSDAGQWKMIGGEKLNPKSIQRGDIVFVKRTLLDEFVRQQFPLIEHPFILITDAAPDPLWPQKYRSLLASDQLAAWFLPNGNAQLSEKIHPLPLGSNPKNWSKDKKDLWHFWSRWSLQKEGKHHYAYLNCSFPLVTAEGDNCLKALSSQSFVTFSKKNRSQDFYRRDSYLEELSDAVFVLVPSQGGSDCFPIWDALVMGCFPVVKSSPMDSLFKELPIVIVEQWEEVTEEFLQAKREELSAKPSAREKFYAPYWLGKIYAVQKKLRSQ